MFNLNVYKNRIACITDNGEQFSYADLQEQIELLSSCISSKSLIFILCNNSIASLVGYLTALQINSVPLLLNKDIDKSLLDLLLKEYKPNYIWLPSDSISDGEYGKVIYEFSGYSLVLCNEVKIKMSDELALLLTTSGSTGSPKLVRLSSKNLLANANSIASYLNIDKGEKAITSLPMYYSYGLSIINSHLLVGATLLLTDYSYVQPQFWDFATANGITSFAGVPFTYEVLKKIDIWKKIPPTLKTFTQAGGKLSNDLISYFASNARDKNLNFFVMYGQTEATARMSYLPCEYNLKKLGSIGFAIPGGSFILKNEKEQIESSQVIGELVYKGDNVCLGYAENTSDLVLSDENTGVLYTGDLAYKDVEGFYYIVGRKKRFLKLFGNRISLDQVEALLKQRFDCEAVCMGTDKKMIIYIVNNLDREEILTYLCNTIKINRIAFDVRFIAKIPRSSTGKILYSELSEF